MAKRIQDFRGFNSSKEEVAAPQKANVRAATKAQKKVVKTKKNIKKDNKEKDNSSTKMSKFLTVICVLLIIVGIAVGCLFSPTFNLANIIVKSGTNITSSEILKSFDVEMETNVFKIDYKNIESSIETLPYIQSADAKLELPNELKIEYIEREPFALVKYLESYLVLDKYGYILEITRDKKFDTLPIIYNIEFDSYEIGKQFDDTAKTKYDNVVYLLENASKSNFEFKIAEINYESISNVKIWVEGEEIEIIYGEIDRNIIGDKLNYISAILNKIKGKNGRLDASSNEYLKKTVFTERF